MVTGGAKAPDNGGKKYTQCLFSLLEVEMRVFGFCFFFKLTRINDNNIVNVSLVLCSNCFHL